MLHPPSKFVMVKPMEHYTALVMIDVISSCNCDIKTPVLHHEPAQPQPRAHEGPVDGEVEDESDARRPGVGQGSWAHNILYTVVVVVAVVYLAA